jgi:5'-nucleotidase (lipoprotein e(P4) family)
MYWFVLLLLTACSATRHTATTNVTSPTVINGKLFATLFQQRAAEYRALCFQAYNQARQRVEQALQTGSSRPMAIITDIDETVLDNSTYEIHQLMQGKDYEPASWYEWTARGEADTVPGAPSFLKYAASKGIRIFYITNRDEKERSGTMKNLQAFHLPDADNEHLLMRQGVSSKEDRRLQVMKNFEVLLLIGDNLADFSQAFDRKTTSERQENTGQLATEFGRRFILLPNPVYGDWETSLYQYNGKLTIAQKDSIVRAAVKGY